MRTANAIDPATRTLLAEIQVPNPTLELFSGAFAEVHLAIPAPRTVFTIPVDTLLFRKEGLQVAAVVDGKVVMKRSRRAATSASASRSPRWLTGTSW